MAMVLAGCCRICNLRARHRVLYRVMLRLRQDLLPALQRMLVLTHHIQDFETMIYESQGGLDAFIPDEAALVSLSTLVYQTITEDMEQAVNTEPIQEEEICQLTSLLSATVGGPFDTDDNRRRRTASSSTAVPATEHGIAQKLEFFREQIRLIGLSCTTGRSDLLREATLALVETAQILSSQMRINVQLLADLLPQPIADSSPTSSARVHGRNFVRDLVVSLQKSFSCNGEEVVGAGPFGIEEVIPILQSLSGTSLEIMALLEDAQLPSFNESGSDEHTQDAHHISDRLATYIGGSGNPDVEYGSALCRPPTNDTQINGTNDADDMRRNIGGANDVVSGAPSAEIVQRTEDASGSKGAPLKGSARGKGRGQKGKGLPKKPKAAFAKAKRGK